jgi:salicylate hydroxylase
LLTYVLNGEQVIIVGAGLGGLGAAIAILLAGHAVTVLESAAEISEVGACYFPSPSRRHYLLKYC